MRTGDCLPDSIPIDCIGLADAFQRFMLQKLYPHIENMNSESLEDAKVQNAALKMRSCISGRNYEKEESVLCSKDSTEYGASHP
jgi:hypothetical protein